MQLRSIYDRVRGRCYDAESGCRSDELRRESMKGHRNCVFSDEVILSSGYVLRGGARRRREIFRFLTEEKHYFKENTFLNLKNTPKCM